jgi:hypothetical protein
MEVRSQLSRDFRRSRYQGLVGRPFAVDEEIFVIGDLVDGDGSMVVEAHSEADAGRRLTLSLADVLERLLVEEEIVLFQPGCFAR